jgi:hypothetical protein
MEAKEISKKASNAKSNMARRVAKATPEIKLSGDTVLGFKFIAHSIQTFPMQSQSLRLEVFARKFRNASR